MKSLASLGGFGGMIAALFIITLMIVVPAVLYKQIPLAKKATAALYPAAAQDWAAYTATQTTPGYPNVVVDWEEVISFDAVYRDQDFRSVSYSQAFARTKEFTKLNMEIHEHCYYPPAPPPPPPPDPPEPPPPPPPPPPPICWDHLHAWYTLNSLEQVMEKHGFSESEKNWAYDLLQNAWMLLKGGFTCEYDPNSQGWVCH